MLTYPVNTMHRAFDWFGLEVELEENRAIIHEGRIGLSDNPLIVNEEGVSGGHYFPETPLTLRDTACFVDLVLDENTNTVMLVVRSDTFNECISHEYRLLFRLMQRDTPQSPWIIAEKEYVYD